MSDILSDSGAEILVRAPLPEGGYREAWVSIAALLAHIAEHVDAELATALERETARIAADHSAGAAPDA
jgi:hypothetical protein